MTVEIKSGTMSSTFVNDEYLPAVITYGKSTDCCRHVVFEKDDTDALELCLDMETGELLKIVLVLCNSFTCTSEHMKIPRAEEATLLFKLPRVTECDSFRMTVYRDGLSIAICNSPVTSYVRAGDAVFGLTGNGDIAEIRICDLSSDEIAHAKELLSE